MKTDKVQGNRSREELFAQLAAHLDVLHTAEETDRQLEAAVAALAELAEQASTSTSELAALLAERTLLFDPVPHAKVAQAQRRASRRRKLLASGAYDIDALAKLRDSSTTAASTWLGRMRDAGRLVSVTGPDQKVWVPALLVDTSDIPAGPHDGVENVLTPLLQVGMDGWAVWVWLTTPSSWLDGAVPAELLATDTARVADGARRFVGHRDGEVDLGYAA